MPEPAFPKSWNQKSKPHKFCPGCGQALALKNLGYTIDTLKIADKMIYATDIGCSLLSWDFFNVDTIQTHHGRVIPTLVGFKMARSDATVVGLVGDGGGYAIGAQHLLNAAMRNDKITVFLINNANYAMTGGQMAPTTLLQQKTETSPGGRQIFQGKPMLGPEMLATITTDDAYLARTNSLDIANCQKTMQKAIQNQLDGRGFSLVEVLSICPINWKTDAAESIAHMQEMIKTFPLGEIKCPPKLS